MNPHFRAITLLLGISLVTGQRILAAELHPGTIAAFEKYVAVTEVRATAAAPPLWIDGLADARRTAALAELRAGRTVVERLQTQDGSREISVPSGMIHHWIGTIFIPGGSVAEAVRLLQDYDRHAEIFSPAVQRSRIVSRDGDLFRIFLRFYQKKGITVVVNSDHTAQFTVLAPGHVASRIVSTRIQEVDEPGRPEEREKPVGRDGGFLWRLNTYWRFLERDGGTYVQCESVTLTRDIPFGLGWLIGPFVTSIPRESLTFTLDTTRKTLLGR